MPEIDRGSQRSGEQSGVPAGLYMQQPQMASNKPQWAGGTPHVVSAPPRDKTWQQQQQDLKHREYLKQQQRLKAMGVPNNKNVSADALIGNLLEKKDTFRPKQAVHSSTTPLANHGMPSAAPVQRAPTEQRAVNEELPPWIWPGSARLPPVYSHIWTLVVDPASGGTFVDTNRIFPLLLTSGLPTQVLGFIWNLAAQGVPGHGETVQGGTGQLTQQQLYVVLALVALAQTGCTFNALSILKMLPQPPIPMFNMGTKGSADNQIHMVAPVAPAPTSVVPTSVVPTHVVPTPVVPTHVVPTPVVPTPVVPTRAVPTPVVPTRAVPTPVVQPVAPVPLPVAIIPNTPFPVSPSQVSLQSTDHQEDLFSSDPKEDDFTEFQSADIPAATVVQPSSAAKQVVSELNHSVIARLGNQGRSIGSRLANHTLGAPKTSRSHHHKHHRSERRLSVDTPYFDDEVTFGGGRSRKLSNDSSYAAKAEDIRYHHDFTDDDDFNDFQMAIGLNVNVDELFPKCKQIKKRTVLLKESAIRNESVEKKEKPEIDMLSLEVPVREQTAEPATAEPATAEPATAEPATIDPPKIPHLLQPPPQAPQSQTSTPQPSTPQTISSPPVQTPIPPPQTPIPPPIHPPGGKELMTVQEDKYSALRFLELESNTTISSDDFGDFVSAEDSFAEIAERKPSDPGPLFFATPKVLADDSVSASADTGKLLFGEPETSQPKVEETKTVEFPVDEWLSFESSSVPEESRRPALEDLSSIFSSLNVSSEPKALEPQTEVTRTICGNDETEDEFGDFIGPDMWGDDKSGKLTAATLSDNRSVSSFEMTNASLSRHGSLPSLDLKIFFQGDDSLDKFKESCVPINEWQRCLDCCVSLLQSAIITFASISQDVVLEVINTAEGRAYFINLKEVRNVSNRIRYSYYRCGQELNQIDTLLKTAQQAWDSLDRYYKLADIDTVDNENREENGSPPCCICCCPASTGALEYNGLLYHASCANLWLNCV